MSRRVDTYVPAIVVDRRNGTTRPKMVVDNGHEFSGTYVKWEDYEALRQNYINLNASYSAVRELDKHE